MRTPRRWLTAATLAALAGLGALPAAQAQYKVVGPDGRITYTDRPPAADAGTRVSPVRNPVAGAAVDPLAALPAALRPVVARFPVTLYTSADCSPCERARLLLRQRGIPHAERRIASEADAQALERLSGGRTVPALAVGQQWQRGLADADWQATLDLAGYPRESQLPRNWVFAEATPLSPRPASGPGTAAAASGLPEQTAQPEPREVAPPPRPAPAPAAAAASGPQIRF